MNVTAVGVSLPCELAADGGRPGRGDEISPFSPIDDAGDIGPSAVRSVLTGVPPPGIPNPDEWGSEGFDIAGCDG